jgi:Alanine-zipper, major outer membrane lipoprotein
MRPSTPRDHRARGFRQSIAVRRSLRNNAGGLSLNSKGKPMTKKLAALIGVALLSGCASQVTTEDLNAVRSIAEGAQSTANDAQRVANEARQLAQGAQTAANQAMRAAQDAQACCDATNQKIDKMFEQKTSK